MGGLAQANDTIERTDITEHARNHENAGRAHTFFDSGSFDFLLDDLALLLGPERRATALVSRDKRLLRLPLVLPLGVTTWRIANAGRAAGRWPS